jgi:hypothetical protein
MRHALADLILVIHFAFVAFVVVGFTLIVIGYFLRWSWIRNRAFRIAHIAAIGIVVLESWVGVLCPLTAWENALRGEGGYGESFIAYWLRQIMYYDLPTWAFTLIYSVFGGAVVLMWIIAPPRFRH